MASPDSSPSPFTIAVGARIGAYEVRACLGAGDMGELYRARDTRLGREVALNLRGWTPPPRTCLDIAAQIADGLAG